MINHVMYFGVFDLQLIMAIDLHYNVIEWKYLLQRNNMCAPWTQRN